MNLQQMEEAMWGVLGYHQTGNRYNWRRQQIRNGLNNVLRRLARMKPLLHDLERVTTIAIVPGTTSYAIDPYCVAPREFWTQDSAAHKVEVLSLPRSTWDGSRNSNIQYAANGPWELVRLPRTSSAEKSGAAGATAGVTVTEAATAITKSGGTAWATSDTGKIIHLNGDGVDYVFTYAGANSGTLDRALRSPLSDGSINENTNGAGQGYTQVRWELAPKGQFKFELLQSPTITQTLYCRYTKRPRVLIYADEVPEISEDFHEMLWQGALAEIELSTEEMVKAAPRIQLFQQLVQEMKDGDNDDENATQDGPRIVQLDGNGQKQRDVIPGISFRSDQ